MVVLTACYMRVFGEGSAGGVRKGGRCKEEWRFKERREIKTQLIHIPLDASYTIFLLCI